MATVLTGEDMKYHKLVLLAPELFIDPDFIFDHNGLCWRDRDGQIVIDTLANSKYYRDGAIALQSNDIYRVLKKDFSNRWQWKELIK